MSTINLLQPETELNIINVITAALKKKDDETDEDLARRTKEIVGCIWKLQGGGLDIGHEVTEQLVGGKSYVVAVSCYTEVFAHNITKSCDRSIFFSKEVHRPPQLLLLLRSLVSPTQLETTTRKLLLTPCRAAAANNPTPASATGINNNMEVATNPPTSAAAVASVPVSTITDAATDPVQAAANNPTSQESSPVDSDPVADNIIGTNQAATSKRSKEGEEERPGKRQKRRGDPIIMAEILNVMKNKLGSRPVSRYTVANNMTKKRNKGSHVFHYSFVELIDEKLVVQVQKAKGLYAPL